MLERSEQAELAPLRSRTMCLEVLVVEEDIGVVVEGKRIMLEEEVPRML
jgi:hypothetical protein